jgi:hypothetical protein
MERNPRTLSSAPCRGLLALTLALAGVSAGQASYTATATSPQTQYTAGASNTFNFAVGVTTNGTAEYVDNIRFVFPAGVAVTGATGPSPYTSCGAGAGNYSNPTAESALWATPGHPSGCGAFDTATYNFSVTVNVPGAFTGDLTVVATTEGDGWPPPLTDPQVSNFNIVYAQACTLTLTCPADQTAAAPPGASGTAVSFPAPTTGGTCTGATVACVPASGDFFPVGTSTVACTATAPGGAPVTCSFDVTVGNQTIQEIPTASTWGLGALALLLAGAAFVALRRVG